MRERENGKCGMENGKLKVEKRIIWDCPIVSGSLGVSELGEMANWCSGWSIECEIVALDSHQGAVSLLCELGNWNTIKPRRRQITSRSFHRRVHGYIPAVCRPICWNHRVRLRKWSWRCRGRSRLTNHQ
jgi:hypothetical protein